MKGNNINKTGHNNKEKGEEYLDFQNNISEIKKYYVQLRQRRVECITNNVLIINPFGEAIKRTQRETERIFGLGDLCKTIFTDMKNMISMDTETIVWKVLSVLVQIEHI